MSNAYTETISSAETLEATPPRRRTWRRWLKWILFLLVAVWLLAELVSLVVQYTRLRDKLTARLEAAFGRSVEVGRYDFSLWDGPVLKAQSVIVGEDPRFGNEYFLRAETMSVRLRLRSLLRGHIELGTLSLSRPSLNLVRNADGDWNLAEWLPRPSAPPLPRTFVGPQLPASLVPRFRKIEVQGGRLNFKRGDDKLPFAFVDVNGSVEMDTPGLWRIRLTAAPYRAAVLMQQAGTLYVSGQIGGTSSRLRPAALDVSWTGASLPDVLRLTHGDDFGLRGTLALAVTARTQDHGDDWAVEARLALHQVHRWDLALRPDNPSLNLTAQTEWHPALPYVDLTEATLEAPHSNVHGSGRISWDRSRPPKGRESQPVEFNITSSQIDFGDLLSWLRAFHSGVAGDVSVRGLADARAGISSWPPRIDSATVTSQGADITGLALRVPAHLGPLQFRYDHGAVSSPPAMLSWSSPAGRVEAALHLDVSTKTTRAALPVWHLSGNSEQVQYLFATARAFGWDISRGWDFVGPISGDLHWQGSPFPQSWTSAGTIDLGGANGASLRVPFLNQPVEGIKAHAEMKSGASHIVLSSARAFGARWNGTLDRHETDTAWQFALSADHLATADLDRWLNPRWRESLLGRMLPFLNSHSSVGAMPESVQASGRITVGQFVLAPLNVRALQGNMSIAGRHIELRDVAGQFYNGTVGGSFDAYLTPEPSYRADLDFTRVDISSLVAGAPSLAGLFSGAGSGHVSLETRGANRSDLAASFTCQGEASAANVKLQTVNLGDSLRAGAFRAGSDQFSNFDAAFTCARRSVSFQRIAFTRAGVAIGGSGSVDFGGNLDFKLGVSSAVSAPPEYISRVTGSLAAPRVTPIATARPRRPAL